MKTMDDLRDNVAIAIDGGGIKGVLVTRALAILEKYLKDENIAQSIYEICRLTAGTSTGSIIATGLAAGIPAERLFQLYCNLGEKIFKKSLRSRFWYLYNYRYSNKPLEKELKRAFKDNIGEDATMGVFWETEPKTDVVITTFDVVENRTLFIKPWKEKYANWPVVNVVLASSAAPTYFPVVDGRYIDGGIGSYGNPAYLAAYELRLVQKWDPEKTTLISLGTGRDPETLKVGDADHFRSWNWLEPILNAFSQSANDQQVHMVDEFFKKLDFRRFQIDFEEPIGMDDPTKINELTKYGDEMGYNIINNIVDDEVISVKATQP